MSAIKISVQGIEASFHDVAAKKYFGAGAEIIYCNSFEASCLALVNGESENCLMAIENSIAGPITKNYDLINNFKLQVNDEISLPVELHLMALPEITIENITEIHSHPVAINQCSKFLQTHGDKKVIAMDDTAACAKRVAANNLKNVAVIAGEATAKKYELNILYHNIHDSENNFTRFLILSKK
ncbi:MAG: hypothetical protein LH473_04500 [Chitinophagales bacterium]|nr:hypothetical protein [Chitinophagales bacterium]